MSEFVTDTQFEILRGLEFLSEQRLRLKDDPYSWKWVIIALDNVLQNAMIETAADTSQTNILSNGEKVYTALRNGDPIPVERLDMFPKLLKLYESDQMLRFEISRKLEPTEKQRASVVELHRNRNKFVHFLPGFGRLRLGGFDAMALDVLDVVRFLLFECGNVIWTEEDQCEKIKAALATLRAHFDTSAS